MAMKKAIILTASSLALAGASGFLTAAAIGAGGSTPTTTTTISVTNGTNGATGPTGPAGPPGPPGGLTCPTGFEAGVLVINHPGGQVRLFTCIGSGG